MTEYVDRDAGREESGRSRRVPEYTPKNPRENRRNRDPEVPEFDSFVKWLPSSNLTRVPVKSFSEVKQRPHEFAFIEEPAVYLPKNRESLVKDLGEIDDLSASWGGRDVRNCDEAPSKVRSGVRFPERVTLHRDLQMDNFIEERLGELIFVEETSFRAFHHDIAEVGHTFATHLHGRKLWLFCQPSWVGKSLDAAARDRREALSLTVKLLQSLSKTQGKQIFWVLAEPGCTVYFPYGALHSVWTQVSAGTVCSMCTIESPVTQEWEDSQKSKLKKYVATGQARN